MAISVLLQVESLGAAGCEVIVLDVPLYDTYDIIKKRWDDGSCNCTLKAVTSCYQRIMVLYVMRNEFATVCTSHRKTFAIQKQNLMIENWFKNTVLSLRFQQRFVERNTKQIF